MAAAFAACDVFLAPCLPSLSHTKARNAASASGARGATLPGVDEELLGRLMSGEFDLMAERSARVAELLTEADEAQFTCPLGSDVTFDLRGRAAISDDGDLRERGAFGNLPCGEGFIAPAGGTGTFFAATIGHLGISDERPSSCASRTAGSCRRPAGLGPAFTEHLDQYGPDGRHLAELGVGTNDRREARREPARGREDPRHGARRVRGERGDRWNGQRPGARGRGRARADTDDR